MGDQFEKFIIENREQFDNQEPPEGLWNKMEQEMAPKRNTLGIFWKIAAVLFLISTLVLLVDKTNDHAGAQLSQEFVQAEDYYVTMINQRKNSIKEQLTPEEEQIFLEEINELDEMYTQLKKTFQSNASNERVVDAMISNLQLRLDILNRQLEILEKINDNKDEKDYILKT